VCEWVRKLPSGTHMIFVSGSTPEQRPLGGNREAYLAQLVKDTFLQAIRESRTFSRLGWILDLNQIAVGAEASPAAAAPAVDTPPRNSLQSVPTPAAGAVLAAVIASASPTLAPAATPALPYSQAQPVVATVKSVFTPTPTPAVPAPASPAPYPDGRVHVPGAAAGVIIPQAPPGLGARPPQGLAPVRAMTEIARLPPAGALQAPAPVARAVTEIGRPHPAGAAPVPPPVAAAPVAVTAPPALPQPPPVRGHQPVFSAAVPDPPMPAAAPDPPMPAWMAGQPAAVAGQPVWLVPETQRIETPEARQMAHQLAGTGA
jgi:hypothetical protein